MRRFRLFWLIALIASGAVSGAAQQPSFVGYIAYVGNDHNVYVLGSDNLASALTADATDSRRYQFPTWSTDGRLAFFCCDITFSPELTMEAYLATPDLTRAKLLYSAENEGYTYSYWAPSNCADGPSCRDLAVLMSQRGQPFKVEIIRNNGVDTTSRTAAEGSPFYISWNQDGKRMLWHRDNSLLTYFDAANNTSAGDLAVTPSGFQAPSWSPVDDRAAVVLLEATGSTNALVVYDGEESSLLVRGIPSSIRGFANILALSWSPDGRYIAYRAINRFGASPAFIIDSVTGVITASTPVNNILAFFWSPDSTKLAYITPGDLEGSASASLRQISYQPQNQFSWSVLNVGTNTATELTSFSPSAAMLYLLAYFDQFSQSHQVWSPDSRHIVYADMADGGSSLIKILDTIADAPVPFTLADGEIGIWSYN